MTREDSTLFTYPTVCCQSSIIFDAVSPAVRDFRCVACNALLANNDTDFETYLTSHHLK